VLDYPPRRLGGTFHLQRRQWSGGIPTRCSISSVVDSVDGGGSFMLPPFLFFSNGGGVKPLPPFIFSIPPRMRGGFPPSGINERRRCATHTPPPFLFIPPLTVVRFPTPLNSGGISSLRSQRTGAHTAPRFFRFERGRRESCTPAPFLILHPPIMGYFIFFLFSIVNNVH
jgi:hypothetical protein